jgi:hypothetical protein
MDKSLIEMGDDTESDCMQDSGLSNDSAGTGYFSESDVIHMNPQDVGCGSLEGRLQEYPNDMTGGRDDSDHLHKRGMAREVSFRDTAEHFVGEIMRETIFRERLMGDPLGPVDPRCDESDINDVDLEASFAPPDIGCGRGWLDMFAPHLSRQDLTGEWCFQDHNGD